MADPRLILGKIIGVSGASPGRASGISYSIAMHDPQVDGIITLTEQKPVKRLPDTIDILAFDIGDIVIGSVESNRVRWHFFEMPAFADCPAGIAPSSPVVSPDDPLAIAPVTPYPTTQYVTVAAGGSQTEIAPAPEGGEP